MTLGVLNESTTPAEPIYDEVVSPASSLTAPQAEQLDIVTIPWQTTVVLSSANFAMVS